jgi:Spy/CpxP family protein refolding chaperone
MVQRIWMAVGVVVCLVAVDFAAAQGPGRGRGGPGGGFGGGGSLGLLQSEAVQKELEMVPEQNEKIAKINEEMREQMREMFSGFRDLSDEERQAKFAEVREQGEKLREELQKKVDAVLMPNQRARLKQIEVQSQIRSRGTAGALAGSQLAEALGLTQEQQDKLREKSEAASQELREKIEELRKETQEKLLDEVLTSDQRAKLKEMIGDQFEGSTFGGGNFQQRGQRGQGGRPGGQGARPGGAGRRPGGGSDSQ